MARWKYRKPEPSTERGFCVLCGVNKQKKRGVNKYRSLCAPCDKKEFSPVSAAKPRKYGGDPHRRPYRKHVGTKCTRCGFIPEHVSQLDVDHIDGNHSNNEISNLQTLCANCHRLKTHQPDKF